MALNIFQLQRLRRRNGRVDLAFEATQSDAAITYVALLMRSERPPNARPLTVGTNLIGGKYTPQQLDPPLPRLIAISAATGLLPRSRFSA